MRELIERLSLAAGVSGAEQEIRALLAQEAETRCDWVKTDRLGNVIAFKKGRSSERRILVAAHMDEVGFLITDVMEDGCLRFDVVGGCDPRTVYGKRVLAGSKKVPGIIGGKTVHQRSAEERDKAFTIDQMYLDIGALTREEAGRLVERGEFCVYDSPFVPFGDGYLKGKALDNRVGCAAALTAMAETPAFDTWFAFTVQEEVGLRGAYAAAYELRPDFAVVLDTTTAADIPGVDEGETACGLDQGTVIFLMESTTYYRRETVEFAVELAGRAGIPWQHKNVVAGGLDAGAIHTALAGVETLSLATPCRYLHSASCVICERDAQRTAALLAEVLGKLDGYLGNVKKDGVPNG